MISYNKIFKALLILSLSVGGLNFINLKENNYIYAQNKTIYQNEDKKEEKGSKKNKDKVKKQDNQDNDCESYETDLNTQNMQAEDGNEKKMTILFTFDSDETGCQYVVFQDPDNDEGEVFASRYDDKGQLIPIESDAEWEMVEEVINTFVEDEENAD